MDVLVSWLGGSDLEGPSGERGIGPLARVLRARRFDKVLLLNDWQHERDIPRVAEYLAWLRETVEAVPEILENPVRLKRGERHFTRFFESAADGITEHKLENETLSFNYSSGMPDMGFALAMLAKTTYPYAPLLQASEEEGVKEIYLPFEVTGILRSQVNAAYRARTAEVIETSPIGDYTYRSEAMADVLERVQQAELGDTNVLVVGEAGTDTDRVARMVAGKRHGSTYVVPCGGIPSSRFEEAFFGRDKDKGHLSRCGQKVLILLDVDHLTPENQAALHYALRHGFQHLNAPASNDLYPPPSTRRIIATSQSDPLTTEGRERFNGALLHELAQNRIVVPPLRHRLEDVEHLAEQILEKLRGAGLAKFTLSDAARAVLRQHSWPNNVDELRSTIQQVTQLPELAATAETVITDKHLRGCIFPPTERDDILSRPILEGFKLKSVLEEVEECYLRRAVEIYGSNNSEIQRRLGIAGKSKVADLRVKYGL